MAKDKKSFVLYLDQKEIFEQLPIDKRGELITLIFQYCNDENPTTEDPLLNMAFTLIKGVLKRDLIKYEEKRKQWSNAGKASAKKRSKQKQQTLTDVDSRSTVSTVSVNDSVNVSVNDTVIDKKIPAYIDFLKYAASKKPKLNPDVLKLKYDSWIENDWRDGNDKPIKNWKTKVLNTLPYIEETTKRVNPNPTLNSIFTDR